MAYPKVLTDGTSINKNKHIVTVSNTKKKNMDGLKINLMNLTYQGLRHLIK